MRSDPVLVPGGRDVRGTLDHATAESEEADRSPACVVACPPHPQHRGHRGDERLRAVSDAVTDRGVDCLRFDYGDWDEGYGECTDADNAVGWALERYERVGLFGFSFGGTVALVTAAGRPELRGVSALAPTAELNPDADAVAALDEIDCPVQLVVATRDTTADWEPVAERARALDCAVTELSTDHFFLGRTDEVGELVGDFLGSRL
ncbi:dienelactone hydrolase family protein [Haloparvum sp. PAK95]|uniref:dienelactone hydrolase family protein n=1 Tax=Haloparvum sp. PAK95 TaxID=3418962 RepID=UPI003D2ED101